MAFDYVYSWGPRLMGFNRKGQFCRVLARGAMNSALIEFEDGFQAVVSRNALRRRREVLVSRSSEDGIECPKINP